MQKELSYSAKVLHSPQRPFIAIIGGAKVSDKILVLENLLNLVDVLIIAGGMAYTFLSVLHGVPIGKSLFDEPGSKLVSSIATHATEKGVRLYLPEDHIIANEFSAEAKKIGVTDNERGIPDSWMGLDIGPKSRQEISLILNSAATIVWNGPVGVYEMKPFAGGTLHCMDALVTATHRGAITILGGGDTASASKALYVGDQPVSSQVSWVSTGGGSSLVLMEGKELPAISILSNIGDDETKLPPEWTQETEPADDGED